MSIGADGRVRVGPDVHVREFDGELVILDLAKGDYFGINEVGARLWQGLTDGRSCAEIARELAPGYETAPEQLLSDLIALTDELIAKGLVEPHSGR